MRARIKQRPLSPVKLFLVALPLIFLNFFLIYRAYVNYKHPHILVIDKSIAILELIAVLFIFIVAITLLICALKLANSQQGKYLSNKKAKRESSLFKNALSEEGAKYIEETQSVLEELIKED